MDQIPKYHGLNTTDQNLVFRHVRTFPSVEVCVYVIRTFVYSEPVCIHYLVYSEPVYTRDLVCSEPTCVHDLVYSEPAYIPDLVYSEPTYTFLSSFCEFDM